MAPEPLFLYLTTTGWKTGRRHEIEIWFTSLEGRYYVISEIGERSHWVQNIRHRAEVTFRVGDTVYEGTARGVDPASEAELDRQVAERSVAKYGWGNGLIVELLCHGVLDDRGEIATGYR